VFFNMLDERAAELGPEVQRQYREFFKLYRFLPFKLYPVKDYLTRIVAVAQCHFGAEGLYRGLFELQAAAFPAWRRTLLGRTTFAVLGNDFDALLRGIERAYATGTPTNHTTFQVTRAAPNRYAVRFGSEYLYIEHAMTGALAGVARGCGYEPAFEVQLDDPFNGTVHLHLQERKAEGSP
jgi:uncharacterized protein (TIGR02265 family)